MSVARRDLVGLVLALLVAGVCVRLGVWQLGRLAERRLYNARLAVARARPPLDLRGQRFPADSLRDRQLRARGLYDYAQERLWHGRSYEGVPGVDLITPLRLADGAAILVDRGWAPSPDGYHVDAPAYREPDSAAVEGFGAAAPRGRGDADPAHLTDSLPYPLLPVVLEAAPAPPPTAAAKPGGAHWVLRRWPPAPLSGGPHLSYAIQWFSFAVIIVVGSIALVRKRGDRELRPPVPPRGTNSDAF